LRQEVQEVRSQLETEKTRGEEIWEELSDTEQALAEVRSENSELRSQLEQKRADREEPEDSEFLKEENEGLKRLLKKSPLALGDFYVELQKLRERHRQYRLKTQAELFDARAIIAGSKPTPAEPALRLEIGELQTQISDLKQKTATANELPEAAEILNQLKSKRKKSKADLTDLELILEILES
jgi:chromosome segregation ATPase